MGAEAFSNFQSETETIDTAKKAFDEIVQEACYQHGHGGYTGTIAEKTEFEMLQAEAVDCKTADLLADANIEDYENGKFQDKWGPAGCIRVEDPDKGNGWLFFGWASS